MVDHCIKQETGARLYLCRTPHTKTRLIELGVPVEIRDTKKKRVRTSPSPIEFTNIHLFGSWIRDPKFFASF